MICNQCHRPIAECNARALAEMGNETVLVTLWGDGVHNDAPWLEAVAEKRLISRSNGSAVDNQPGDYIALKSPPWA